MIIGREELQIKCSHYNSKKEEQFEISCQSLQERFIHSFSNHSHTPVGWPLAWVNTVIPGYAIFYL